MSTSSTPHCCYVWPKIAGRFCWFELDGEPDVSVMPCLFANNEYWRVNYCPSCGAPRRSTIWNHEAPIND